VVLKVTEHGRWEVVLREANNVRYYIVRDKLNRRKQIQISSLSLGDDIISLINCLQDIVIYEDNIPR